LLSAAGDKSNLLFLFWGDDPEQIGQSATKLMHLGHQQLQSVIEIDDNASLELSAAGDKSMMLGKDVHIPLREMCCKYPPKRFGPGEI
jgi:hypothetical protein